MRTCAFTGYRPEKLPFGGDESKPEIDRIKQRLYCEELRLTREGVKVFISGMARGVDLWAAEMALHIRDTLPSRKIQLWLAIPYDRQAEAWSVSERERYEHILQQADRIDYVSHAYYPGCLSKRNRWMVERAHCLLAVYDGKPGGTKQTIDYARRRGLDITIIEP